MNQYETIFLIAKDTLEEERKQIVTRIENYLNENGKITKTEALGLRRLAYEVKKCKEAYYYLLEFESAPKTVSELERKYRLDDQILKFIIVRKDM